MKLSQLLMLQVKSPASQRRSLKSLVSYCSTLATPVCSDDIWERLGGQGLGSAAGERTVGAAGAASAQRPRPCHGKELFPQR